MKKINILFIFIFSVPSATFAQQSDLLEKYRSMAVEYNHDLKAADKHISASIELEKAAQKDLRPKLSGDANFQYTGNPIRLTLNLPSMQNPLTFEGKDMKYGTSLTLLQPVYTGGRLLETIRMAKHQHSLAAHQAEYFRSAVCYQTDMYNPQIQISAESETKRSIFREKDKTKRSKKESAQHSKSRNKSFVMTSVSAL